MEMELEREERYLVIDPTGELRWIRTDRAHWYEDFCAAIDCGSLLGFDTVLPGIVFVVDYDAQYPPLEELNLFASRLFTGREVEDFIFGPAVVASLGQVDGECSYVPCSDAQLQCVAQYLQIELPEVTGDE